MGPVLILGFTGLDSLNGIYKEQVNRISMEMKMGQIVLDWTGPLIMMEPTPRKWYGVIGLYAIEYDSNIIYLGKAECQGAIKEARSHRGLCEKRLKELGTPWDAARAMIYVGTVSEDQQASIIDHAENLLIYKIQPSCNRQLRERYTGEEPFLVVNNGQRPKGLPKQIRYPDP